MSETVIIALISLLGTLGGTFGGILATSKLTNYRIEQLEKKVDKHNNLIERTFRLEDNDKLIMQKIALKSKKKLQNLGTHLYFLPTLIYLFQKHCKNSHGVSEKASPLP